jgi:maltose phosphorylase
MAGTWMSLVEGFGGKRIKGDTLILNPMIPENWKSYSFKIMFRNCLLEIVVTNEDVRITNLNGKQVALLLYGKEYSLAGGKMIKVKTMNYYLNKSYEKQTITNH